MKKKPQTSKSKDVVIKAKMELDARPAMASIKDFRKEIKAAYREIAALIKSTKWPSIKNKR